MTDGSRSMQVIGAVAALTACGVLLSLGVDSALAAVLMLVGLAVMTAEPASCAPAAMLALPFVYRPVAVGSGDFSLLELALVIGAAAIGLRLIGEMVLGRSLVPLWRLLRPLDLTLVAAALVAIGALSLTTIADRGHLTESLRQLRVVIVEPALAIVAVRWAVLRGQRASVTIALIASGCVASGWGIIELLRGIGVVIADGVSRATGPFPHPNNLALFLDRPALLAIGLLVAWPQGRRWLLPVAVLLLAGLAVTFSRGAVIALLAGGAWVVVTARPRQGWRWFGALGGGALLLFLGLASARLLDRGGTGTASSRLEIWRGSWAMLRDHPWTGVGLDQFLYQYGRRYVSPTGWAERYTSHPHNLLLDVWLSLGILGVAVFGALAIAAGRSIAGALRDPQRRAIAIAAGAALIGGVTHGMVDNGFFLPELATVTWSLIALTGPVPGPEWRADG